MHSRLVRVLAVATVAGAALGGCTSLVAPAEVQDDAPAELSIVPEWNAIAERILDESGTPDPASGLYLGFVSVAMFDAVVAIEGRFDQYIKRDRDFGPASSEVAAATAAVVVLRHLFPESAEQLSAGFRRTTAGIPRDTASANGSRAGIAAAAALIVRRLGDGRNDRGVTLEVPQGAGFWRPTPPDSAPMAVPWLAFVEPLVLDSATRFALPEPPPLASEAYAEDFNEVKQLGSAGGRDRTAAQTENAHFFAVSPVEQYHEAMRDVVTRHRLDIVSSARAFALLSTSLAEAAISCGRARFDHPTWRPDTAIRLAHTDGNAATERDADWEPLMPTPPSPEFASQHACLTGAASGTFAYLFGPEPMDLRLRSAHAALPEPLDRHYTRAADLDRDAMNAGVWQGIHFRSSLRSAIQLGHNVAEWAQDNHFRPKALVPSRAMGIVPPRRY